MNQQLVNLDVTSCFEVKNNKIFGSEGSIGYTNVVYNGVRFSKKLFDKIFDNSDIQKQVARVAKGLGVNPEDGKSAVCPVYDKEANKVFELAAKRNVSNIECEYTDTDSSFTITVAGTDKSIEITPSFSGKVITELN